MFILVFLKFKYFLFHIEASYCNFIITISDIPGCTICVDICYNIPLLITTVFLKISPQVQNMYMWRIS